MAPHVAAAFGLAVRPLYETVDGTLRRIGAAPRRGTDLFALAVTPPCAYRGDPAGFGLRSARSNSAGCAGDAAGAS